MGFRLVTSRGARPNPHRGRGRARDLVAGEGRQSGLGTTTAGSSALTRQWVLSRGTCAWRLGGRGRWGGRRPGGRRGNWRIDRAD